MTDTQEQDEASPVQALQIGLQAPQGWDEVDPSPHGRKVYARKQAKRAVEAIPSLKGRQEQIERGVRDMLARSWAGGVRYTVSMSEPTSDGLLFGSVSLIVLPEPPDRDGVSVFEAITATIHQADEESDNGDESDISMVSLPNVGKALRVLGHHSSQIEGSAKPMRYSLMQTYVPAGGQVVMVQGMTPNREAEQEMFELFDLVTSTLRIEQMEEGLV